MKGFKQGHVENFSRFDCTSIPENVASQRLLLVALTYRRGICRWGEVTGEDAQRGFSQMCRSYKERMEVDLTSPKCSYFQRVEHSLRLILSRHSTAVCPILTLFFRGYLRSNITLVNYSCTDKTLLTFQIVTIQIQKMKPQSSLHPDIRIYALVR